MTNEILPVILPAIYFADGPAAIWAAVTPEDVADVLDGAADYMETNGWAQGVFATHDGRVCALGAIQRAAGAIHQAQRVARALRIAAAVMQLRRATHTTHIPDWNDDPERTQQEVLDALRLAAKETRMEAVA